MKTDLNSLLFNGAGILMLGISGVYVFMSHFDETATPTCSERFPPAIEFGLERSGGGLMSNIELQARAGLREWGMLENAKVVKVKDGPASLALEVNLEPKQVAFGKREPGSRNGIGLQWSPQDFKPANSACLRYSVQVAEDFEFGMQGILPGLYGGRAFDPSKASDGKNGFTARLIWRADRSVEGLAQVPAANNSAEGMPIEATNFELPRGQWVNIEQELVLNTPGQQDGILRVWADGKLKIDRADIEWRTDENLKIDGVLGHIDHGSIVRSMPAVRETKLKITPFVLSWQ